MSTASRDQMLGSISRQHRPATVLVIVVVALTLVGMPSATAQPDGPADVLLEDCTETFLLVEGDDEAIRAAVPQPYTLGSEPPLGDLWSITSTCASIRVGGRPAGSATITFLGAAIQSPEPGGTNPIHSYLFWAITNSRSLGKTLSAAGFPSHYESGAGQTFTPGVALPHAQLSVPWTFSPYRIASAQSPLTTHPHAHDASWWHEGELGPHRIVVHHSEFAEHISDCGIATQEGTMLAKLLGASERSTPCFLQGPVDSTIEF